MTLHGKTYLNAFANGISYIEDIFGIKRDSHEKLYLLAIYSGAQKFFNIIVGVVCV